MSDRSQLKFALGAFAAGLAWGYIRYRRSGRAPLMSVLQALEWFIAYGGAVALITILRESMEPATPDDPDDAPHERITHFRQAVPSVSHFASCARDEFETRAARSSLPLATVATRCTGRVG